MRNRTLHLHIRAGKQVYRKFKTAVVAFAFLCAGQNAFSQSVGINTNNPDPSASLEVAGTNKGLLIPRISLQSLTDNATIPNPATALLIYNTNAGLGKAGFYYNAGTPGNPSWTGLSGGGLTFPSLNTTSLNGAAFYLENGALNTDAIAIQSTANYGIGIHGSTFFGKGVVGHTFQNGVGVLASSATVNAMALDVSGRMRIAGPGQNPGAGKVLTSDGSGFATWQNSVNSDVVTFAASGVAGGGSVNIPANTKVKVAFANEEYDLSGNYNDLNQSPHSTFIAPQKGIYNFNATVAWSTSGVNSTLFLFRTRNGDVTEIRAAAVENSSNMSITTDVALEVGDQIDLRVQQYNLPTAKLAFNNTHVYFTGRLVTKQQ
ncbi:hypothetical protein [Dyadobacter alkalitolerans]|uniref:hypothetical protein n=1 Tax=Dyadobacter alkalitolerans TaxID=492736 RepID=UPI0004065ACA|nr:hypothetical protein [Dyadobacter alkalitolerans]